MPLLYIDVPELHQDSPSEDLMVLVKTFQWQDWTELRLTDRDSPAYRMAVRALAVSLVEANREADKSASRTVIDSDARSKDNSSPGRSETADSNSDEELGAMDLLAQTEQVMPGLLATAEAMGAELVGLGPMFDRAVADMKRSDLSGGGFAGRVRVARSLANELGPWRTDFTRNAITSQRNCTPPIPGSEY